MDVYAIHFRLLLKAALPPTHDVHLMPLRRPMLCQRRPAVGAGVDEGSIPSGDDEEGQVRSEE